MAFNKFPSLAVVTSTSMHQSCLQEAVLVVARGNFSRLASWGRSTPQSAAAVPALGPPLTRQQSQRCLRPTAGQRTEGQSAASLGGRRGQEGRHVRVVGPWGLGTHSLGSGPSAPAHGTPRFLQGCSGEVGQVGGWARAGSAPMPEALQSPPVLKLAGGPVPLSMWVPCGLLV